MKKLMIMLLAVITMTCAWALTGGNGQGYDPTNPPDPNAAYRLTVEVSPSKLGGVSPAGSSLRSYGDQIYISAQSHVGYDFRCWMEGEEVVSESPDFYYEMPARNVKLTAWYDRNTYYNPENPGDPFFDGYTHRVNVYCTPGNGGSVNNSNFLMKEGDETTLYAYPGGNFKFSCWKQAGKIISVDPALPIKMGKENLSYTAQFVYSPQNPGDPGTNNWNLALGDLVIDNFQPGDLWGTISRLVGEENYDKVNTITVIGRMDDYDMSCMRNLPGLSEADFSRTYGATRVPDRTFESCHALTRVQLPASIASIDWYAFYDCINLSELSCYASMPPSVGYAAFNGVPESLVVKVYANSVDLYMQADTWRDYKIMTLDEETTALSVTLPADAKDGRYVNASLQLDNLATGQSSRLVVTASRNRYIFGNLMPGMKYSLYALAPGGQMLGQFPDFEMPEEGLDYEFESLKPLRTVSLTIKSSEGTDLSDMAKVNWFDERHAFLGSGNELTGRVEGDCLSYEILPERDMSLEYSAAANGEFKVKASDNEITVVVKPLEKYYFSGVILDGGEKTPVKGAYVTVSQKINGEETSTTVTTDAEGKYSLELIDMPGTLSAGSPEHIEETVDFQNLKNLSSFSSLAIKPIYGAEIMLDLRTAANVVKGEAHKFISFEDYANLSFLITDMTDGRQIANYRLRYPRLRLLDGVADDARLRVVVLPRDENYNVDASEVQMQKGAGKATLTFLRNGDLNVTCKESDVENPVALLYDEKGALRKRLEFGAENEVTFRSLPEGKYSVVAMMESSLYSGAGSLAELEHSRLAKDKDYLIKDCEITDGYISTLQFGTIPEFEESLFYYTGPETMLGLNKTSVTVGQTVTVRAKVDFMPEYAGKIEKVKITFSYPEGVDYVENSMLLPGGGSNFTTVAGNQVSVDLPVADAAPRFCVVPRKSGNHRISASIEFKLAGETIVQPIGSVQLNADDFGISAPDYTYIPRITVRGCATPLSELKVYDNEVLVGRARSLTNGEWRLTFDLYNPGEGSEHFIYADITTADGTKYRTSTARTVYDPAWAQLTDVLMINGGSTVDFNQVDATTTPGSYNYWPGTDMFTFKAIFRDGAAKSVDTLDFLIMLSDGSTRRIDSKYLPSQDAWVCALGFDDANRLPVNVKVLYSTDPDTPATTLRMEEGETLRCPDAVPIIDPSGYVYEAVASNRLEGVQATIFYKEWAEDMYGDVYENVMRWDAESYAQQNPLFTDADGMYQWDVPSGEWQVRFEKEGYEAARTEWLPVPPPQLDVNMGLVQLAAPGVAEVKAYEKAIEVTFDKYMQPSTLTSSTIGVTVGGNAVEGTLTMLGEETAPDGNVYVTGVRFDAAEQFAGDEVTLVISSRASSYAGIPMEGDYTQEMDVEPEITAIEAPESMKAYIGYDVVIPVRVNPGEAAAGKKIIATLTSPIASLENEVTLDADGRCELHIEGELPGETRVNISVEGSKAESARTNIIFAIAPDPCAAPIASIASGTKVNPDTIVELSTETEGAEILFTRDGSDPATSETAMVYSEPIVLTHDTTIRAIAREENHLDSPESVYTYEVDTTVGADTVYGDNGGYTFSGEMLTLLEDAEVVISNETGIILLGPVKALSGDKISLESLRGGVLIVKVGNRPGVKLQF